LSFSPLAQDQTTAVIASEAKQSLATMAARKHEIAASDCVLLAMTGFLWPWRLK
jgi:hypothetical protein